MKNNPTANTWYNVADSSLSFGTMFVPRGIWRIYYHVSLYGQTEAAQTNWSCGATLSATAGAEDDQEMTSVVGGAGASSLNQSIGSVYRSKIINQQTEVNVEYFLNIRTTHTDMDWIGQLNTYWGWRILGIESVYV
jgi:hypothetical protein